MSKEHLYFAYGDQQDRDLFSAIIGREVRDEQIKPAIIFGQKLCVQRINDIDPDVQNILSIHRTDEELATFSAYALMRMHGSRVKGVAARVTSEELELLDNWDITGEWYTRNDQASVQIGIRSFAATAHVILADKNKKLQGARERFGTAEPPVFLNDRDRTIEIAKRVRTEYLATQA